MTGRGRRSGRGTRGGAISVGRLLGVRIQVHVSWFIIFALVAVALATSGSPFTDVELSTGMRWVAGVVVAVLFFGSVLVHELAHAFVARRMGLVVSEITLYIFGGAANLESEAPHARTEALVAGAGPLASVVMGCLFLGVTLAFRDAEPEALRAVAQASLWLGATNLLLAIFNLIPAFPMDGGRMLRALLWGATKNFVRATRIATLLGRLFAYGLIAYGLFLAVSSGGPDGLLSGIWLVFIGFFLNQSAEASYRRVAVEKLVEGITVRDVMDREVPAVGPNLTLDTLVDQHLLSGHAALYPVTMEGDLVGTVDITQVSKVPRTDWPTTRVTEVMARGERLHTLTEPQPLWQAIMRFEETGSAAIPVVDSETGRRLLGLVTRDGVFRALRARAQLQA